jgi:Copper/zinc superoxide dismutase (SODC)
MRLRQMDSRKNQGEAAMVDKSTLTAVLAMNLFLAAPAAAADKTTAVLKVSKGNEVGKAELTATPSGVLISLDLTAVPAGEHAFHIHAVGKCEPPDSSPPVPILIPGFLSWAAQSRNKCERRSDPETGLKDRVLMVRTASPRFGPISTCLACNGGVFGIGGFEPPQPS